MPPMPGISDVDELRGAIDRFSLDRPAPELDPAAGALAQASLTRSGLLLVGEVHGVAENPLVIVGNGSLRCRGRCDRVSTCRA